MGKKSAVHLLGGKVGEACSKAISCLLNLLIYLLRSIAKVESISSGQGEGGVWKSFKEVINRAILNQKQKRKEREREGER